MEEADSRARRRLSHLARHVGPIIQQQEDHSWRVNSHVASSSRSLSTLACSAGGGWDGFQRRDNRTLFARQSSDSHGQFMRQASRKQDARAGEPKVDADFKTSASGLRPDGICKCGSPSAGRNTKGASDYTPRPSLAAVIEPLFARPALQTDPIEKVVTEVPAQNPQPEVPALCQERESNSRGSSNSEGAESGQPPVADRKEEDSPTAKDQTRNDSFGFEWFPRMDVVESGSAYVITVELPGVSAEGIHVEVSRGSLIVTGSRATDWWKASNNGNGTVYHRRELAQGPYRAVWRLPKNGNINGTTAEFIDGFLRVLVPKIKVMTYL
ncbi:unnamed protein product [Calypogeia fissa]